MESIGTCPKTKSTIWQLRRNLFAPIALRATTISADTGVASLPIHGVKGLRQRGLTIDMTEPALRGLQAQPFLAGTALCLRL